MKHEKVNITMTITVNVGAAAVAKAVLEANETSDVSYKNNRFATQPAIK